MRWYVETKKSPQLYAQVVFTRDNTVASYSKGRVGVEPPDEERVAEHDSSDDTIEEAQAWLLKKIQDGFVLSTPPDERFQQDPVIAAWWQDDFPALFADKKRDTPTNYAERVRALHAEPFAPELEAFIELRSNHDFGYSSVGEWRIWDDDAWLPDADAGNLFEQLVSLDQRNYLGTAMMEYFVGMVCLGTAGNGDVYFAHTNTMDPTQAEVAFWDHETQSLEFVIADSLSTLAWANHLYEELEDEDFDSNTHIKGMERIQERANLSWHYSSLAEEAEFEPEYEAKSRVQYFFYRSYWLLYLLAQNGVVSVEDAGEMFHEQFHAPLNFDNAVSSPYLATSPVTALYWLWRLWWFNKEDDLERCIEVTQSHGSPVVRDATALVQELQDGRKNLGKIEDMHALRERWLALDLDPDRAEARAEEQAAAEAETERKRLEDIQKTAEMIEGKSWQELVETAWEHVGNQTIIGALYEAIEETAGDELADAFARWRFVTEGGSSRDGLSFSFENEEVFEALSHTGSALVPCMLTEHHQMWFDVAARAGGERVRPFLAPVVDEESEYNHRQTAAIRGLVATGAVELLPKLHDVLDTYIWDADDYMSGISQKDICLAAIEGIGELGGPEDALKLAARLTPELPKDLVARTLVNVGKAGDASVCGALLPYLNTERARATLFALARAGDAATLAAVEEHLAAEDLSFPETMYEFVMVELLKSRCGGEMDHEIPIAASLVIESMKFEDVELHLAVIALLGAHPDWEVASPIVERYRDHEARAVRDAALALGCQKGESWKDKFADRAALDAAAKRDPSTVFGWIDDGDVRFKHNVLRKAVDTGGFEAHMDDAIAFMDTRLCYATQYTNPYVQDEHKRTFYAIEALARLGGDKAYSYLAKLMTHTNKMYAAANVLKYDRDEILSKLQPFIARNKAATPDSVPNVYPVKVRKLAASPWLFGAKINGMAWSPDGQTLAVAGKGGVVLMDAGGGVRAQCPGTKGGWIYDVDFHPGGNFLAMGAHAGHLHVIDAATGVTVNILKGHSGVPNGVRKVKFSPDGSKLATVSCDQTTRIWDTSDPTGDVDNVAVIQSKSDVNTVDWLSEERLVIATDRRAHLLSVEGEVLASVDTGGVASVRVNPNRDRVYVGAKSIRVFDAELNEVEDAALEQDSVARIRFTPDGKFLYAASYSGSSMGVWKWTLETGERQACAGHDSAVFAMDYNPHASEVTAGGDLSSVYRWDTQNALIPNVAVFHTNEVGGFVMGCDGSLFTVSDDRAAIRWNMDSGAALKVYQADFMMTDAALSEDETTLYVSGFDHVVAFDVESGELKWDAETKRSEGLSVFGDVVVAASYNGLVWLDGATGEELHRTEPFADSFIFRWMKLDDRRVAVAGYDDDRFFVWDVQTRELLATHELPATQKSGVCNETFGGGRIWASRWDKSVVVLDADSGDVLKKIRLSGTRYPIAANPSGTLLVITAGTKGFVYDGETYAELGEFEHPGSLECLAFVSDEVAVAGATTGEITIFDFTPA